MKYALLRYLAIRPDTSGTDSNPLFVSERGGKSRYSRNAVVSMVTNLTEEEGWYEKGEDLTKKVLHTTSAATTDRTSVMLYSNTSEVTKVVTS